jgi:hypothetical protein
MTPGRFPLRRFKATTGPKLLSPGSGVPLMWFTWTLECFSRTVRSYWLNLPSVLFVPICVGSALRSSGSRVDRRVASNTAVDLPCPWVPLQSVTAVASRRVPVRFVDRVFAEASTWCGRGDCNQRPEGIETIYPDSRVQPARGQVAQEWCRGRRRFLPGIRLLPAKQVQAIVGVSVYRADTFRSQGFSPSQRFCPAWTLWLCFTPHPPVGFRSSELILYASSSISRCSLLSCR